MKNLITLCFLIILSGCAVNMKSTYRNKQYNDKLDSVSLSWADQNFILRISLSAQGYKPTITEQDKIEAQKEAKKAIANIKNNYQKTFAKYFNEYGIEITDSSPVNLQISTTPVMEVKCTDHAKGAVCTPQLDMTLKLVDKDKKTHIWSGTVRVVDYGMKGKRDANGNLLEGTYNVVDDFAIAVIKTLEDEKLAARKVQ